MYEIVVDNFLKHLSTIKNASEHTVRNYSIDLKSFAVFIEDNNKTLDLKKIDRKHIRNFIAHLTTKELNKKSIARRFSTLRSFFAYAYEKKHIEINPTETLDAPKIEKKIPQALKYEQVEVLFQQPDISTLLGLRDRAIMELFYSSGLRLSELAGINRRDIDFAFRLIKVRGKGKKERLIPVSSHAVEWITKYLNLPERYKDMDGHKAEVDSEAVFLNRFGKRITARSIDRHFESYFKNTGLAGKVTPHTIRHTIATHWLEKGMDLKTIQQLLGHNTLATTTIYTKVSNTLKDKVYRESHPRA